MEYLTTKITLHLSKKIFPRRFKIPILNGFQIGNFGSNNLTFVPSPFIPNSAVETKKKEKFIFEGECEGLIDDLFPEYPQKLLSRLITLDNMIVIEITQVPEREEFIDLHILSQNASCRYRFSAENQELRRLVDADQKGLKLEPEGILLEKIMAKYDLESACNNEVQHFLKKVYPLL